MEKQYDKAAFAELEHKLKYANKRKKKNGLWNLFSFDSLRSYNPENYAKKKEVIKEFYDVNDFAVNALKIRKYDIHKTDTTKYSIILPIILSIIATILCNTAEGFYYEYVEPIGESLREYIKMVVTYRNEIRQYAELKADVISTLILFILVMLILVICAFVILKMLPSIIVVFVDGMRMENHYIRQYELEYIDKLIEKKLLDESNNIENYIIEFNQEYLVLERQIQNIKESFETVKEEYDNYKKDKNEHDEKDERILLEKKLKIKSEIDKIKDMQVKVDEIVKK